MSPSSRLLSLAVIALLTSCGVRPIADEHPSFGRHATKLEEVKEKDVSDFLAEEWSKFDKYVKHASGIFSAKEHPVYWGLKLTPPLPTNWPPTPSPSVTYYAYGEYQELFEHGPSLSRSAPWAKVILTEGMPPSKVILATALGPATHGEGSVPISRKQAERKIQIIKDGEARLINFISWRAIPDDAVEVKAIREYYCQWALTDLTADLIKDKHRGFFEWLSCPPPTGIPVLSSIS